MSEGTPATQPCRLAGKDHAEDCPSKKCLNCGNAKKTTGGSHNGLVPDERPAGVPAIVFTDCATCKVFMKYGDQPPIALPGGDAAFMERLPDKWAAFFFGQALPEFIKARNARRTERLVRAFAKAIVDSTEDDDDDEEEEGDDAPPEPAPAAQAEPAAPPAATAAE